MFTILILVLLIAAAYFILGVPIMDYIHRFVQQFTHSFPVLVFFLPRRAAGAGRFGKGPR